MKFLQTLAAAGLVAAGLATASASAFAADISGAGATFPYPVYAKWAEAYKKETGNGLNYQSIGSGGGIKQITARTVTFGASDMPLKPEDLEKNGLIQFPTVMGGIVPVVNLDGVKSGDLTIDGPTLAKIFLGDIKKWNDPALAKLNPNAKLPDQAIALVHRSDGSGTTFIFTNYLSKVSGDWKSKVGSSTANLKFTWATSGKLLEGIFYYQLIDCGANKVVGSKTMEYPNGTSKKTASASAKFKVVKGHKYKMRVRGQGSYQRRPDSLGALGFFYGMAGTGVKPWMAESSCVKAK